MIDLILKIKQLWKQFVCIHEYEPIETLNFTFLRCRKCNKIKK